MGKDLTIKDLSLLMKKVIGFEGNIIFDDTKPDGTPKKLLDVSKIHSLGWHHKIDIVEGLQSTYNHYVKTIK